MIVRLLIGVGLFTLGYVIGKAVGSAQPSGISGHLIWEEEDEPLTRRQVRPDADFAEVHPKQPEPSESG